MVSQQMQTIVLHDSAILAIKNNSSTKFECDRLLKTASYILGRAAWQGYNPSQFFDIPCQNLKGISGDNYRSDIEKLKALKVVDCTESYQTFKNGKKGYCKQYRFLELLSLMSLKTMTLKKSTLKKEKSLSNTEAKTLETLKKVSVLVDKKVLTNKTTSPEAAHYLKKLLIATITPKTIFDRHIKGRVGENIEDEMIAKTFYFEKNGTGAWVLDPISANGRNESKRRGKQAKSLALNGNYQLVHYKNDFILTPSVDEFLKFKTNEIQTLAYIQLESIRTGDLYSGRNEINYRLDTSITNLSGILDSYLILDGKPMKHFDLANSQFIILSTLISQILQGKGELINLLKKHFVGDRAKFLEHLNCLSGVINSENIKEDFKRFHEASAIGKVYDDFARSAKIDRDDAKKAFFLIAFGDINLKGRLFELFRDTYPSVFEIIQQFKKDMDDFKQFPIFLQAVESCIFIDELLPLLFKKGLSPLSKHDSILLKSTEAILGEMAIKKILDKVLVNYKIK
jgi:hypothetical protein